ncbi:MAG: efflux RND transporter periplasmic adaptor subunit, partial [Thermoanaerobaculia bacterium]
MLTSAVIPQSTYDSVAAQSKQAIARVGEIEATIARKTIRAPFSGVLGIRKVNLGQYLSGGEAIVSLQSLRPAYVEFDVPQQDLAKLKIGGEVEATTESIGSVESGRITAYDSRIDPVTRNVRVQASFDNRSGNLHPGMFVDVHLSAGTNVAVIPLPSSAISYAPFGNSVYIVENVKGEDGKSYRGVRQQFVKTGASRGDQVAVLSGVKPGEEVVTSGAFKLRPGAAVIVNNQVQPSNNPSPNPADS